jgi:hypothetical protein
VCCLHAQIAGDKLTQLAAQHWSEAAQAKPDRPAFSPEIVQQIYKQELGGGNSKPPLMKRVMLLEVRGLLWCYLCGVAMPCFIDPLPQSRCPYTLTGCSALQQQQ